MKIMSEFGRICSIENPNGTPMKMLIDREMSKDTDSWHNPPGVVAKLMGLDALPQTLPDIAAKRNPSVSYSQTHSDAPSSYWKNNVSLDRDLQPEFDRHEEYTDIYEIWQKSCRRNCPRNKSPLRGRYNDTIDDTKMDLVRQKFTEAKSMASNEKLRQSKQFQDALEVLSSNRDSFLKFLQEPNSLLSQHLYNTLSTPPPKTKRITVLRPSKMVDHRNFPAENDKLHMNRTTQMNSLDRTCEGFSPQASSWKVEENIMQPTRIVVLKPSPRKPQNIQATDSTRSASYKISHGGEFSRKLPQKTRLVASTIPQLMREKLDRKDEILLSSAFSNGYIGDDNSFNKLENDSDPANISDSEVISPASRHSWENVKRFDSPCSSSFSHSSYSPESSVCREAKKRLSERWVMVASNGGYQGPKHFQRSSSTLGEMLVLSDVKKEGRLGEECTSNREEPMVSSAFLNNNLSKDERMENSPKDLVRSKSVPMSSTEFGTRSEDVPDPEGAKLEVLQDELKIRSSKSSFKGKVSSLFFSRNKKTSTERSSRYQSKEETFSGGIKSSSVGNVNYGMKYADHSQLEYSSPDLSSGQEASPKFNGNQSVNYHEPGLSSAGKLLEFGNTGENLDQPSHMLVLEAPSEKDKHTALGSSYEADHHGMDKLVYPSKLNQIDKSPLIGSIARTPSWEDSRVNTASSYPSKSFLSTRAAQDKQEECLFFIQTLLSLAGLDGELQATSFLARWHSHESPLDPSLREKYIASSDKEILQEAKRRQRLSTQKLVFDCVNAAMIDIAGYGSDTCQRAIPNIGSHTDLLESTSSFKMVDRVWSQMREWFSSETRCVRGDSNDINSLVVEMVVRKVVDNKWIEHLRLEMDNLGKEIEQNLLDELVQEAVVELTDQ